MNDDKTLVESLCYKHFVDNGFLELVLFSHCYPQRRVVRTAATAAKSSGAGSTEEKGFLDFILGGLAKEDQFYETDPILKKVEEKTTGTVSGRKNSVAAAPPPPKKKDGGGFGLGGLFAKK
ncbi:UNVERIFIED_CONTAM: hypothetical protein Sangu_0299000 [Sesamum angustifolium]|uniref:Uncharacterized protein n=1 Tax=Sesamum angustifolium TaxID=2727405 RepID=A0AAW2QPQ1_9LAMI